MHVLPALLLALATAGLIHTFPSSPHLEGIILRSTDKADKPLRARCKSSKQPQICDGSAIYDCKALTHGEDCADRGCYEYTKKDGVDRPTQGQCHDSKKEREKLEEKKADMVKNLAEDIKSKARKSENGEGGLLNAIQAANTIGKADEEARKKVDAMNIQPEVTRTLRRGHQKNGGTQGDHSRKQPNKKPAQTLPITSRMVQTGGYSDQDLAGFVRLTSQCVNENMATVCGIDNRAVMDCNTLDVKEWCSSKCHQVAANQDPGKPGEAFCNVDDAAAARREKSIPEPKKQKRSLPMTAEMAKKNYRNWVMAMFTRLESQCVNENMASVCDMGHNTIIDCATLEDKKWCNHKCFEIPAQRTTGKKSNAYCMLDDGAEARPAASHESTPAAKKGAELDVKTPQLGESTAKFKRADRNNSTRPVGVPGRGQWRNTAMPADTPKTNRMAYLKNMHKNELEAYRAVERRCNSERMLSVCMGKGVVDCETLNVIELCADNEECQEYNSKGASGFGEATCVAAAKKTSKGKAGSSQVSSAGTLAQTKKRNYGTAMGSINVPNQEDTLTVLKRIDTPIAAQKGFTGNLHPDTLSGLISVEKKCKKNNMASVCGGTGGQIIYDCTTLTEIAFCINDNCEEQQLDPKSGKKGTARCVKKEDALIPSKVNPEDTPIMDKWEGSGADPRVKNLSFIEGMQELEEHCRRTNMASVCALDDILSCSTLKRIKTCPRDRCREKISKVPMEQHKTIGDGGSADCLSAEKGHGELQEGGKFKVSTGLTNMVMTTAWSEGIRFGLDTEGGTKRKGEDLESEGAKKPDIGQA